MVEARLRAIRLSIRNSEAVHGSPRDQYRRGQQVARDHIKEENFGGTVQGAISVAKDLLDLDGMTTIEYDDYWGRGYLSVISTLGGQRSPARGTTIPWVQMVGRRKRLALRASQGHLKAHPLTSCGADRGIGYQGRIKAGTSRPEVSAGIARLVPPRPTEPKSEPVYFHRPK